MFGLSCTCGLQRFRRNGRGGYVEIGEGRRPWIQALVRVVQALIRMRREENARENENRGFRDNAQDERLADHIRVHVGEEVGRIGGVAGDQGDQGAEPEQEAAVEQVAVADQGAAAVQGAAGIQGRGDNQEGQGEVRRRRSPPHPEDQGAGAVGPINQPGLGMQFGPNGDAENVGPGPARNARPGPNDGVQNRRPPSPLVQEVQGLRHSLRQAAAEAAARIHDLKARRQI